MTVITEAPRRAHPRGAVSVPSSSHIGLSEGGGEPRESVFVLAAVEREGPEVGNDAVIPGRPLG